MQYQMCNNKLIEKFSGGNYFEFRHYFLQKRVVADVVGNNETFVHKRTAGNQSVVLQSGRREIFVNEFEMAQTSDGFGGNYPIGSIRN